MGPGGHLDGDGARWVPGVPVDTVSCGSVSKPLATTRT